MSTDQQDPTPEFPPRVVLFSREIHSAERAAKLQELIAQSAKLDHPRGKMVITQHGDDSPMACHTGSLFADTQHKWNQVAKECYTSKANKPLKLLQFYGFDDGDYIIYTEMSWRLKLRSVVNGNEAFMSICSVPTNGLLCPLSSDEPPSSTATICALGGAHFNPECDIPQPYNARHRFQHQPGGDDGSLADVVLTVGSSFSAKFTATNPAECAVVLGFSEHPEFEQHFEELLGRH